MTSNLLINKIVHIVGASMEQTIIDGQNSRVIYIDVPPICQLYISNLKLTNGEANNYLNSPTNHASALYVHHGNVESNYISLTTMTMVIVIQLH